jgi:glycosyltransferase involved in cell wall biosynthesis
MDNPLVSVTIPTYNRSELLTELTLPSVLNQTYQNFEIVIVGDCCTDDTEERIAKLNDPRIRFYNLPQRGPYPSDRYLLWCVAGVPPMNRALDEARGLWIAHLDDDDVWKPQHLELALEAAYRTNAELASSGTLLQRSPSEWIEYIPRKAYRFGSQTTSHSSVVFRYYLKLFRYSEDVWRIPMPADRHLFMRMARAGVRHCFITELTVLKPLRPNTTKPDSEAEDRANLSP